MDGKLIALGWDDGEAMSFKGQMKVNTNTAKELISKYYPKEVE